jgi:hypothetical protein
MIFLLGIGTLVYWLLRDQAFDKEMPVSQHIGVIMFVAPIYGTGIYVCYKAYFLKNLKMSTRWKKVVIDERGLTVDDLYGRQEVLQSYNIENFSISIEKEKKKRETGRDYYNFYFYFIVRYKQGQLKFKFFGETKNYDKLNQIRHTIKKFCEDQLGWSYNPKYSQKVRVKRFFQLIYFVTSVLLISRMVEF